MTEDAAQSRDPDAPIRVMLVDDHVFWRRGVKQIIDEQSDMEVVAEASNGEEAVARAPVARPDIILMDVNMPKMSGVQATRAIADMQPDTRIVMLSVSDTDDNLFESLKAGAVGFLSKDVDPDEVTRAVRSTMEGESTLSRFLAARLVKYVQRGEPEHARKAPSNLTEREEEILRLIARGARDREIAQQLYISESTVKKHVQNVLRKLQARNRVEAVSYLDPSGR